MSGTNVRMSRRGSSGKLPGCTKLTLSNYILEIFPPLFFPTAEEKRQRDSKLHWQEKMATFTLRTPTTPNIYTVHYRETPGRANGSVRRRSSQGDNRYLAVGQELSIESMGSHLTGAAGIG